jgi:glycosyltransferase involved in cell wall biosynthesis
MELDVLIPAYNEAGYIGRTVSALRTLPEVNQIIVIDDGSTDGTAIEAGRAGAKVIRMAGNRGKGEAVLFGARFACAPYLALIDADLGDSAAEIRRLVGPIREGKAAMTIARFPPQRRRGGIGLVKRLATWSIRRCTGLLMQEPLSGQRILRRELLALLRFPPRGFGLEVALTMDLLNQGYPVLEVSTQMSHRYRGKNPGSWLHRVRQGLAVLRELWLRRDTFGRGEIG